jgi:hypothetical protein
MANINTYAVESVRINDKILASDGISGATKSISAGDISDLSGCKVYRAFLTQTGTSAPVPTIVGTNTIGTIVWARSSAGVYTATLLNGFVGSVTSIAGLSAVSATDIRIAFTKTSSDVVTFNIYQNDVLTDAILSSQYIEIRVY